jgi:hypothetical protein
MVCRESWAGLQKLDTLDGFNKSYQEVSKALRKGSIREAFFSVYEYCNNALGFPSFMKTETGKTAGRETSGQPWYQLMKLTLMKHLSHSEQTLMDRPLALCIADWFCVLEMEGLIKLDSVESVEATNQAKSMAGMGRDELRRRFQGGTNGA